MRIADAAGVIQTSAKSIRKWIEMDGRDGTRWLAHARTGSQGTPAEFTDLDLLRMRLLVVLLNYGATFQEAWEQINLVWMPLGRDPIESDAAEDHIAWILDHFFTLPRENPEAPDRIEDGVLILEHYDRLICTILRGKKHEVSVKFWRSTWPEKTVPFAALVIKPKELFIETLARARAVREKRAA